MQINNNLGSMLASQVQLNQSASNLAQVANTVADPQFQEVTGDLVSSMVGQIPQIIAYEVNAKSVKVQEAVLDNLLDIHA